MDRSWNNWRIFAGCPGGIGGRGIYVFSRKEYGIKNVSLLILEFHCGSSIEMTRFFVGYFFETVQGFTEFTL